MASIQYKARFQVSGTIYKIGEVQTFASGFTKRELVVNTNATRPSPVALQLFKEDCAKADSLKVGDAVEIEGTINGREWNGAANGTKFFTDLIIKSVMVNGASVEAKPAMPPAPADEDLSELPF